MLVFCSGLKPRTCRSLHEKTEHSNIQVLTCTMMSNKCLYSCLCRIFLARTQTLVYINLKNVHLTQAWIQTSIFKTCERRRLADVCRVYDGNEDFFQIWDLVCLSFDRHTCVCKISRVWWAAVEFMNVLLTRCFIDVSVSISWNWGFWLQKSQRFIHFWDHFALFFRGLMWTCVQTHVDMHIRGVNMLL